MIQAALDARARDIQTALDATMTGYGTAPVAAGMRHARHGGRRVRGFLVIESAGLFGVAPEAAMPAAEAIEALHAYSLVHDDLPCMDDDDLRRGQPTVHVKWDEATAVLVGDALQTLAFARLADLGAPAEHVVALTATLAEASGARGMVLGQSQDIAAETTKRPLDLAGITALQANKTGALIRLRPMTFIADPHARWVLI